MRVAMVCLGNICRSPMAASVASAMVDAAGLASSVQVESFGTAGYHAGRPADDQARDALRRRGWPADGHCARHIRVEDIAAAGLVLVADRANLADVTRLARSEVDRAKVRLLRSFDPDARGDDVEVPDPWGGTDRDFDHSLALIEAACRGLVAHLAGARR